MSGVFRVQHPNDACVCLFARRYTGSDSCWCDGNILTRSVIRTHPGSIVWAHERNTDTQQSDWYSDRAHGSHTATRSNIQSVKNLGNKIECIFVHFAADPALLKFCLKPRGQFPSKSCNKYVNCWDGVVLEQECPGGLLFSSKGYCDYPANVDCSNRTPPSNFTFYLPNSFYLW